MSSLARWTRPPKVSVRDLLWTILPMLLWLGGVSARSHVLKPYCSTEPARCTRESIPSFDRPSVDLESGDADQYSADTQYLAGVMAVAIPLAWNGARIALGTVTPFVAGAAIGADVLLFVQAWAWNGCLTELSHLVTNRPRPFVYHDPSGRGRDPAHYTSFYSGHTSFAACCALFLTLTLLARGAPLALTCAVAFLGGTLTLLTGIFRVMAGRHFTSDVAAAAVAGALVAILLASAHRPRKR